MPVLDTPRKTSPAPPKKEKKLTIASESTLTKPNEEVPMSAASTIPDSTNASQEPRRISFPGVADLFVRLRRHRHLSSNGARSDGTLAKSHHIVSESGQDPLSHPQILEEMIHPTPPNSPTLPTTPSKEASMSESQKHRVSSGSITFPAPKSPKRRSVLHIPLDDVELERSYTFVCSGAVNVPVLLTATRREIRAEADNLGANALAKEHWSCTICGPKHRKDGTFRVHIQYSACPLRTKAADPNKPVSLDKARSVPGLMTILKRTSH